MLGGKGQMAGIMQAAQRMQKSMEIAKEKLANTPIHAEAGNGLVKVEVLGNHTLKQISIDPSLLKETDYDLEMVQDLIVTAINQANQLIEQRSKDIMKEAGVPTSIGGINIPGL